jgi:hypothetical protein
VSGIGKASFRFMIVVAGLPPLQAYSPAAPDIVPPPLAIEYSRQSYHLKVIAKKRFFSVLSRVPGRTPVSTLGQDGPLVGQHVRKSALTSVIIVRVSATISSFGKLCQKM